MNRYLLLLSSTPADESIADGLVRTAASFLAFSGAFERVDLGAFRRQARGVSVDEILRVVRFDADGGGGVDDARARSLERVLRETLATAGARGEVRVFVDVSPVDATDEA